MAIDESVVTGQASLEFMGWRGSEDAHAGRHPCCLPRGGPGPHSSQGTELALSGGRGGSPFLPEEQASPLDAQPLAQGISTW